MKSTVLSKLSKFLPENYTIDNDRIAFREGTIVEAIQDAEMCRVIKQIFQRSGIAHYTHYENGYVTRIWSNNLVPMTVTETSKVSENESFLLAVEAILELQELVFR